MFFLFSDFSMGYHLIPFQFYVSILNYLFIYFIPLKDENVDMDFYDIPVNAAATALKQFFMDLASPLVPTQLYDELIEVAGKDKKRDMIGVIGS